MLGQPGQWAVVGNASAAVHGYSKGSELMRRLPGCIAGVLPPAQSEDDRDTKHARHRIAHTLPQGQAPAPVLTCIAHVGRSSRPYAGPGPAARTTRTQPASLRSEPLDRRHLTIGNPNCRGARSPLQLRRMRVCQLRFRTRSRCMRGPFKTYSHCIRLWGLLRGRVVSVYATRSSRNAERPLYDAGAMF